MNMKYRGYMGVAKPQATLTIKHMDADGNVLKRKRGGLLGLLGLMIPDVQIAHGAVTDAFVAFLVDAMIPNGGVQLALLDDFEFHDSGIGTDAEDAANTALQTPCGIGRVAGTQVEGATTNIYKSVGVITYDGDYAVVEHGLFNVSTVGTLMDRTKFGAVNVANTEKIEFTYELTISSGG